MTFGRLVIVGLTWTVVLGAAAPAVRPAAAGLAVEVERLQDEVEALRRVVPAQAGDPGRLADFERRLGRLEEELRRLTGRIEQVEFGQRRLQQRFDQLVGDLDRRLGDLEEGVARSDPAGEGDGQAPPDVAQRPAAAPAPAEAPPAPAAEARAPGDAPEPDEGTLGSVPESAMLSAPRPAPESTTAPERGDLSAQEQYDAAMDLLRAGDYAGAQRGLELFLELHPDHALAANAAYWLAESHYVRKNYAAAAAAFARNYRTYGRGATKAPDNLLKLGMSLEGLGETEKACLSFEELAQEFPNAPAHIKQALARERQRAECI